MLHQVDEEVGGAVEHGEQVGQLGDVLDPVRPQQLALHTVAQDFRFFPRYYSMYYIYNGTYRTVFSTFIALLLSVFIRKLLFFRNLTFKVCSCFTEGIKKSCLYYTYVLLQNCIELMQSYYSACLSFLPAKIDLTYLQN